MTRSKSFSNVTGVTAPQPVPAKDLGKLVPRIVSALILAPAALFVIYLGPPASDVMILLAAALLGYEWQQTCCGERLGPAGLVVIAALAGAPLMGAFQHFELAGWWLATGAMAAAVLARPGRGSPAIWLALGVIYLGAACLSLQWFRSNPSTGMALTFWLFATVWATDTFAYLVGRKVGGPRLAPTISPKKTWAGLLAGVFAATAVGLITALLLQGPSLYHFALISALLALVAQAGDLLASAVKRRFGAKDFGRLIPGHGGLLDRVDGLAAAALFVAVANWLGGS